MAFTEIDEKLLVRAYQAGDDRAFDTIVRTQYNALYAHALRRLSNSESAEDAVQDTLIRAYRALPNLDGDLALRAWLHRILTNVCHDEGNRIRRRQGLVEKLGAFPEEVAADPAEEAEVFDTVRIMSEALQDLPESYREALVLRYVDGLSFREVAEATGVTEENARARVHRGRHALHKIMSRVAVMVAFIVPGLKRTQSAPPAGTEQAAVTTSSSGAAEHVVSLTTQLTTHVVNVAPTVSRFAEMTASLPGGKSTLAAAAVTAVAAMSVPVAYTVNEVRKPERPSAAVAAPLPTTPTTGPSASGAPQAAAPPSEAVVPTTTAVPATTTSLPASLARPFVGDAPTSTTVKPAPAPTSTTTSTTVAVPPPVAQQPAVVARFGASALSVTGSAPQFDLAGTARFESGERREEGQLSGRLYVNEDGTVTTDGLELVLGDRTLKLRFRSSSVAEQEGAFTGSYSLRGGAELEVAESGDLSGTFRTTGGTGSLTLELREQGER